MTNWSLWKNVNIDELSLYHYVCVLSRFREIDFEASEGSIVASVTEAWSYYSQNFILTLLHLRDVVPDWFLCFLNDNALTAKKLPFFVGKFKGSRFGLIIKCSWKLKMVGSGFSIRAGVRVGKHLSGILRKLCFGTATEFSLRSY